MYGKILVAVTALALSAGSVSALSVDQSYLPPAFAPPFVFAQAAIDSTVQRGQTFTVGTDGNLAGVRVNISDKGNFDDFPDAILTVSIFDVTDNETDGPIDIAGGPLLSGTVGRTLGSTGAADFKLTEVLFGSTIAVEVGDVLAIVLSAEDPTKPNGNVGQNDGFWWAQGGNLAGYAAGQPYRTNQSFDLLPGEVADYQFATLMSDTPIPIPVPASLPLLLGGVGALGLMRRLRTRD